MIRNYAEKASPAKIEARHDAGGPKTRGMIAPIAFALAAMTMAHGQNAFAQSEPMTVIQDDLPPTAPQQRPVTRDPAEILGIRIESNGALITGPMNARRVFIPLDRPIVPTGMLGHWARSADACSAPPEGHRGVVDAVAENNVFLTSDEIVARQRMRIVQAFVPLPSTFTLATLQSGRKLVLPARKHRAAEEILVILAMPDGKRDYSIINLLSEGQALDLRNRNSHETAVRCAQ